MKFEWPVMLEAEVAIYEEIKENKQDWWFRICIYLDKNLKSNKTLKILIFCIKCLYKSFSFNRTYLKKIKYKVLL